MRLRKTLGVREKRVRIQNVVAQEFKQLAVILIRARSRHYVNNGAAAIAELSAEGRLLDREFLNRLHRWNI